MSSPTLSSSSPASDPAERALRGRVLTAILVVSWLDLAMLAVLVYGVVADDPNFKAVLGPLHGVGVIAEVGLVAMGALKGWWGWWYPIVTVVTTGPPGAILGHRRAKREALGA